MKTSKKILVGIIAIFTILLCFVFTASAETYSGECGAQGNNLIWNLDTETGKLTVTGKGKMENFYEYYYVPWYKYRDSIKSIEIGDGVTSIGNWAFEPCENATDVELSDTITSIGRYAFYNTKITEITIPDSVTNIGDYAFYDCYALVRANIPAKVESMGYHVFGHCSKLEEITIADGVKNIGDYTFIYCKNLKSIVIPGSVGRLGTELFYECNNLESVTIGEGVTEIGYYAFYYCSKLKNITIPDSVTTIGSGAFNNCRSLESIAIPEGVTYISIAAFNDCDALKVVSIPVSVTEIDINAFNGIDALTDVYYGGTDEEWENVIVGETGNEILNKATIHFTHKHSYSVEVLNAPTCNNDGTGRYICECGKNEIRAVPATGHTMGEWFVSKAGTCVSAGEEKRVCTVCGADETRVVVNGGHKDADNNGECDECSDVLCTHLCHKSGFMGFIYKIVRCFWKLFKMNPVCSCGAAHY